MLERKYQYRNPLDYLLRRLSPQFHQTFGIKLFLDTIFFSVFLLYTFLCCFYGVTKIGINILKVENYGFRIKKRDTLPQALSVISMLMILMMFSFTMQLMQFAPQYLTFGYQKDEQNELCSLEESQMSKHAVESHMHKNMVGIGCQMTIVA